MGKHVFICNCKTGNKVSQEKISKFKQAFLEKNIAHTIIEDLCGTVVKNPEKLSVLKQDEGVMLLGCYPRAMEVLLQKAGIRMCCTDIEFHDMQNDCVDCVLSSFEPMQGNGDVIPYNEEWNPWYPVIDYSRCTGCQKCLNFCLFGVYKKDEHGNVIVAQPSNCKYLCPACARTCPEQAIVFPKFHESPIDGGEGEINVLSENEILEQLQKSDNIYDVLAQRRKSFNTNLLKEEQEKIAEAERACCSVETKPANEEKDVKSDGENSGCCCCC